MSDFNPRPGDTDNNLLRKILDRLNEGLTLFGEQGELPIDVEIVAVANFPVVQHVEVINWPATQNINGVISVANFPATQPVSGTVNVGNLPATQPVSGTVGVNNFPATQPVSGTVGVSNFPATQPVSVALPLDTYLRDEHTGHRAHVSNFDQLHAESQVRLVGQSFNTGSTLDPNFWTPVTSGSGTATVSVGVLSLRTGATADSTSRLSSVRVARHIGSTQNIFRTVIRANDTGAANNVRRWGCFTANDGFFFQLNGTAMQIGYRIGGATTLVNQVNWNGTNTFVFDVNWHSYEIHYSVSRAYFYIDSVLVHTLSIIGGVIVLGSTQNLPVAYDNINSSGGTADVRIFATHGLISRLGVLVSNNRFANITSATTTVLKYSAGVLGKLLIGNPAGSVTIYDNTSAAGTIITTLDLTGVASATVMGLDVAFNVGLTVVTSSASVNLTVVYE